MCVICVSLCCSFKTFSYTRNNCHWLLFIQCRYLDMFASYQRCTNHSPLMHVIKWAIQLHPRFILLSATTHLCPTSGTRWSLTRVQGRSRRNYRCPVRRDFSITTVWSRSRMYSCTMKVTTDAGWIGSMVEAHSKLYNYCCKVRTQMSGY